MSKIIVGAVLTVSVVTGAVMYTEYFPQKISQADAVVRPALRPQSEPDTEADVEVEPVAVRPSQVSASPEKEMESSELPAIEPEPVYKFDKEAINSLQQTRLNGDSRAPKLTEIERERTLPTAEELADPKLYSAYETRTKEQMWRAYAAAADERIPELEQAMQEAETLGLEPEQLEEGYTKIEALKEMQAQVKAKLKANGSNP